MHEVQFPDDQPLQDLIRRESTRKTMLTEFFHRNSVDLNARQYLYREFPEHYTWSSKQKCWNDRVSPAKVIGRLHTVTPGDPERYYLRLLLNHVRGPTSFQSLRTVIINNRAVVLSTFKAAAEQLGLLEKDTAIRDCLLEASAVQMPSALTQLFGSLLAFCSPVDASTLWEEFKEFMAQKYSGSATSAHALNSVLIDLQALLEEHNKKLSDFGLPSVSEHYSANNGCPREITEELNIATPSADLQLFEKLNSEQRHAFCTIINAAVHRQPESDHLFFIDGPGGTGKTFLYRALLAHFRSRGQLAIATATSGLAAIMMPGGRTAHSRFKIPVPIAPTSTCKIGAGSGLARLLIEASIIIWDEATMGHKYLFEALDRSLQDIMKSDRVFGGKLIVFGGDYRQVLPIVPRGSRSDVVSSTFRHSYLWPFIRVIPLTQNMRALSDPSFSDFLLRVGNGTEVTYAPDTIMLPDSITLPWTSHSSVDELITTIFPTLSTNAINPDFLIDRAILTTTNAFVDELNEKVLADFPGETFSYYSFDSVENDSLGLYQIEFLNSINQATLPAHQLKLKKGAPIMLTRNVNPRKGLCNGTRLLCRNFYPNFIDAEIVSGTFNGATTFLHRIPLNSTADMNLSFSFTRKQFPIRLGFVLTVHKAQGQTIPFTGIYLPHDVFTHGQLYVALSRGKSANHTCVLVKDGTIFNHSGVYTKNVVYNEVL